MYPGTSIDITFSLIIQHIQAASVLIIQHIQAFVKTLFEKIRKIKDNPLPCGKHRHLFFQGNQNDFRRNSATDPEQTGSDARSDKQSASFPFLESAEQTVSGIYDQCADKRKDDLPAVRMPGK
mgnify:CR=1 FL=1